MGAITINVVFTFPNRGWLKRCLNAFLRGAMVREKKTLGRSVLSRNDHCALADPCSPRRSMKPHRHFFALSSSSSFASGKSTFLPLPFFRTVDIVNARDSSTTAQVKKHSSHRRG